MEENDRIVRQLENKIARLDNILNSYLPTDHMKYEAHKRRVTNAAAFIKELKEVIEEIKLCFSNIKRVPLPSFKKQLDRADFVTIEYDGKYCKLSTIHTFPYEPVMLLYVASESVL